MVTRGGDLQPGRLDDRLLTGLGQPQTKSISSERKSLVSVLLRKEIMNKLVVDLLQQKGLGC
jgi:hypothetical protein